MSIKLEEMMNEFRYPSQITTDKAFVTTSSITAASASVTGSFAVGNDLTVADTLTVTGASTFGGAQTVNASMTVTGNAIITGNTTVGGTMTVTGISTLGATGSAGYTVLGTGGPQLISGTLAPPANPTGITAAKGSLFINLTGTGVTNRVYINTDGATAWTFLATSGA